MTRAIFIYTKIYTNILYYGVLLNQQVANTNTNIINIHNNIHNNNNNIGIRSIVIVLLVVLLLFSGLI